MRFKSFVINIEANTGRRAHILKQISNSGLDVEFFNAITPATMDNYLHKYNRNKAINFTGRPLYDTEISCGLSHMTLWRQLLDDTDVDHYLIMEDDIHIVENIQQIIDKIDFKDIHFLKLSGQQKRPIRPVRNIDNAHELYQYAYGPLDAACYIVDKYAAKKLIEFCQYLYAPIDIMMDRSYDHGVPIYGVMPYPTQTQFCFDDGKVLYTDIGVRNSDYKKNQKLKTKIMVRMYRLYGSLKRKLATIKLRLVSL